MLKALHLAYMSLEFLHIAKWFFNMLNVSFARVLTKEAIEATFDALAAMHDCGFLNGDIQCPNFLVDNIAHQGVH